MKLETRAGYRHFLSRILVARTGGIMAGVRLAALVRRVRRDEPGGSSDADLLARFVRSRDEAVFELLVWRHGAMVLSSCRRILRHAEDAEDAFQAVFLVLARKARGVSRGGALPAWLHRVAVRIALRHAASRRSVLPLEVEPAVTRPDDAIKSESLGILDEEIDRLGERHRTAVVLCYLDGLSAAEAGQRLDCPTGTVESRLAAARKRLRKALARRGVTLPVGALALVATQGALAPEAIAKLTRTSIAFARGEAIANETSVRMAKGVITMWQTRTLAGTILVAAILAIGAGFGWANWPTHAQSPNNPVATLPAAPSPEARPDPKPAADGWPFARRTNAFGGSLLGVTADGRSVVVNHGRQVFGLDITEKLGNGSMSFHLRSPNEINDAAVSPDGRLAATAEGVNGVKLRDTKSGEIVAALWPSSKLPAEKVAFTADGSRLVAVGIRSGDPPRPVGKRGGFGGSGGGFPDPERVRNAKVTIQAQISVWDVATRKELGHSVETTTLPQSVIVSARIPTYTLDRNGGFVLKMETLYAERKPDPNGPGFPGQLGERIGFQFTVIDAVSGKARQPVEVKDVILNPFSASPLSPDGKTLLVVDLTNRLELRLLDAVTGKERVRLSNLLRPVKVASFSPDGRFVAAASGRQLSRADEQLAAPSEVVIWDTATGKELARLTDKESIRDYTALAFSPDGKFIVAEEQDGSYTFWGQLPEQKTEPVKPPVAVKEPRTPAADVPDRFQKLFEALSADGVTDSRRIEAVFLAALGRLPSEVESQTLTAQFARQSEKTAALRDLLKTLTATAEFKAHAQALGKLAK